MLRWILLHLSKTPINFPRNCMPFPRLLFDPSVDSLNLLTNIKGRLLLQTLILINFIVYFDQLPPLNMNLRRTPYLEPSRTSTMELICENTKRQLNIPIIDWVLNTSLSYIVYSTTLDVTPYSRLLFWIPLTVCPGGKYSVSNNFTKKMRGRSS